MSQDEELAANGKPFDVEAYRRRKQRIARCFDDDECREEYMTAARGLLAILQDDDQSKTEPSNDARQDT